MQLPSNTDGSPNTALDQGNLLLSRWTETCENTLSLVCFQVHVKTSWGTHPSELMRHIAGTEVSGGGGLTHSTDRLIFRYLGK